MTERLHFHALEKEMATHSSILARRIPGMGEPDGLPSMGSHRVVYGVAQSRTRLKRLSSSSRSCKKRTLKYGQTLWPEANHSQC